MFFDHLALSSDLLKRSISNHTLAKFKPRWVFWKSTISLKENLNNYNCRHQFLHGWVFPLSDRERQRVLFDQPTKAEAKWNVVNHKIKTNEASALMVCGNRGKCVRARSKAWKEGECLRLRGRKIEIVQAEICYCNCVQSACLPACYKDR